MSDPLLGSGVRPRRIPGRRQIASERDRRCAIDLGAKRRCNIVPSDAVLQVGDPLQRHVPQVFVVAGDQPLGGVDHLVAAGGDGEAS